MSMRDMGPQSRGWSKGRQMTNDESMPAPEWEPRAVTRARGLTDLLSRRPELTGVYLPADVTVDALRWSA